LKLKKKNQQKNAYTQKDEQCFRFLSSSAELGNLKISGWIRSTGQQAGCGYLLISPICCLDCQVHPAIFSPCFVIFTVPF
jgi:hypothetical protein